MILDEMHGRQDRKTPAVPPLWASDEKAQLLEAIMFASLLHLVFRYPPGSVSSDALLDLCLQMLSRFCVFRFPPASACNLAIMH